MSPEKVVEVLPDVDDYRAYIIFFQWSAVPSYGCHFSIRVSIRLIYLVLVAATSFPRSVVLVGRLSVLEPLSTLPCRWIPMT